MSETRGLLADVLPFSAVDGPGNRFVAFLQGCNFDCLACHNPQTIPTRSPHARWVTPAELVEEVRGPAPYLSGVTVSGGEPTQQPAFLVAFLRSLKADPELRRLTTLVDTNGSASRTLWDALAPVLDGAMVDLKCFDDERHLQLTGTSNRAVLESIRYLSERGRLHEVRLLVVPGRNDDPDLLARTGAWLCTVDPGTAVRVLGFRRHGARADAQRWAETTPEQLETAAAILRSTGLTDVQAR